MSQQTIAKLLERKIIAVNDTMEHSVEYVWITENFAMTFECDGYSFLVDTISFDIEENCYTLTESSDLSITVPMADGYNFYKLDSI